MFQILKVFSHWTDGTGESTKMGAEIIGIQAQIRFRKSSRRGKLITQRSGTFFLFVGDGIQWKFMHIESVFIYTCPLDTCIYKIRRAV
jgi:hypothetical protein